MRNLCDPTLKKSKLKKKKKVNCYIERNAIFITYLNESQTHSTAPKYSKLVIWVYFLKVVRVATT